MEFRLHEQVRLREDIGEVRAGSIGRVIGWLRHSPSNPSYVVAFDDGVLKLGKEVLAPPAPGDSLSSP